jgi:hypothetical protein
MLIFDTIVAFFLIRHPVHPKRVLDMSISWPLNLNKRPCFCTAANRREVPKAAADQAYSITSSAMASRDGGTVRPSTLSVVRLSTVSYCTGMSGGFSPLRMRST